VKELVVAAKAVILDQDDNVLILYRSETHPTEPHFPDLPGGIVEDDEHFHDALSREVDEECALDVRDIDFRLVYADTAIVKDVNITRLFYLLRIAGVCPEVVISWEHEKYEWIKFDDIKNLKFENFIIDALRHVTDNRIKID
jgi:8-oxo-dGTP pyrophosphatase MutT (NUDIX family)